MPPVHFTTGQTQRGRKVGAKPTNKAAAPDPIDRGGKGVLKKLTAEETAAAKALPQRETGETELSSVDTYQGQKRDLVLLDLIIAPLDSNLQDPVE